MTTIFAPLTPHPNNEKPSSASALRQFLLVRTAIIISVSIVLLSLSIFLFYCFCDRERKVTFDENVESALDEMARYDAKQRLKNRKNNRKAEKQNRNATQANTKV